MQGFILPELIIESIIRDGLQNVREDKTILDSIFAPLTRSYNNRKYGEGEITKIKALVDKEMAVIYSYNQVESKELSFSIMVGADNESKGRAHLGDDYESVEEQIVDAAELEALHRVDDLDVTSYDPLTGKVVVAAGTNLGPVYKSMIYVDSNDEEHIILGGISNASGDKYFFIDKEREVDISDDTGYIKSSLDYKAYDIKGVTNEANLVIGCHSKDALTTKYLYILLKYFILSRKKDIISRGLYTISFSGSDFNRNSDFVGDQVYTRWLTITGKTDDTWRADQVDLFDNIVVNPIPIE